MLGDGDSASRTHNSQFNHPYGYQPPPPPVEETIPVRSQADIDYELKVSFRHYQRYYPFKSTWELALTSLSGVLFSNNGQFEVQKCNNNYKRSVFNQVSYVTCTENEKLIVLQIPS